MLNYICFIITTISIHLFIKYEGPERFYDLAIIKYNKWKSLNGLVSSKYTSYLMIKFTSLIMLFEREYLKVIQYLTDSTKKIDKHTYEVSYIINGKFYKMVVNPCRGPCPIIQILNEYKIDVTEMVVPYLGPNNDFYGKNFFPEYFGFKKLTFELLNGEMKIFNDRETININ